MPICSKTCHYFTKHQNERCSLESCHIKSAQLISWFNIDQRSAHYCVDEDLTTMKTYMFMQYRETFSSRFSRNSEVNASEILENFEKRHNNHPS